MPAAVGREGVDTGMLAETGDLRPERNDGVPAGRWRISSMRAGQPAGGRKAAANRHGSAPAPDAAPTAVGWRRDRRPRLFFVPVCPGVLRAEMGGFGVVADAGDRGGLGGRGEERYG